ncbi:MAG TPA: DNA polymerase Y family protein [Terriglobales bacterium]|nr:DNA polymerase Y family protein [Terriglobales bacterium]
MPFACIYVPGFPVEAILRAEPELRAQALAVLEGKAPLQKVFAVNEKARRDGITSGMTKIQVEACVQLALRERSLLQESATHAVLLECAQGFSPRVEDLAADTFVLDITGLGKLFGALPKIAREIAKRISNIGLQCNVAVAANPDTAMLAARGFDGVTVIPEGREAEQLGCLPVEVLCAGEGDPESEQLLETLHRWGIRNLRDLAALPEVALSERLGRRGLEWQRLARGASSRTLVPFEPPLIFEEAIELEHPVVLLEPLAILLGGMLEQLCSRLQAHALATQELRLELELENGCIEDCHPEQACSVLAVKDLDETPHRDPASRITISARRASLFRRTLRLPLPLLDPRTFLKLLQLDLNAHPPGAPIVKIHLMAEPTRPRAAQNGFFLPPSPEPEKLELTMAKIAGIVGEDRVGSLELLDTHRPERFEMQHFTPCTENENPRRGFTRIHADQANQKSKTKDSSVSQCLHGGEDLVTALRRFRPRAAATVTIHDGKPAHVSCCKRLEINSEVLWTAGPWRLSGDWWEHNGWARDEWDIAVQEESGIALYRLVRDLLSGKWFVEGTYD